MARPVSNSIAARIRRNTTLRPCFALAKRPNNRSFAVGPQCDRPAYPPANFVESFPRRTVSPDRAKCDYLSASPQSPSIRSMHSDRVSIWVRRRLQRVGDCSAVSRHVFVPQAPNERHLQSSDIHSIRLPHLRVRAHRNVWRNRRLVVSVYNCPNIRYSLHCGATIAIRPPPIVRTAPEKCEANVHSAKCFRTSEVRLPRFVPPMPRRTLFLHTHVHPMRAPFATTVVVFLPSTELPNSSLHCAPYIVPFFVGVAVSLYFQFFHLYSPYKRITPLTGDFRA